MGNSGLSAGKSGGKIGLDFATTNAKMRTYCKPRENYWCSQGELAKWADKTRAFSRPIGETDRSASSGRRFTILRDGVGGVYLTHHIWKDRRHRKCVRLRSLTAAIRGCLSFAASGLLFRHFCNPKSKE